MLITRRAEFSASHVCASPNLSEAENRERYGAAANPNGHGHNYIVEVTLEGEPDPVTGMVFDLRQLKEILNEAVIQDLDHRFLNKEVPPFDRIVPTAENVALEIWKRLERRIPTPATLRNVRLYETEDLWVDYSGGEPCSG
jgi:6-pyruvoyltetrahydropterin/6-carboxytetrahydropterin synthase